MNKKEFKFLLVLYLSIIFVILIIFLLRVLSIRTNKIDAPKYTNEISINSLNNNINFRTLGSNNINTNINFNSNNNIKTKNIKVMNNGEEFYGLVNKGYKLLDTSNINDYLLSFRFIINNPNNLNIYLSDLSKLTEYLNKIEALIYSNIKVGIYQTVNRVEINTTGKLYHFDMDPTYSINKDSINIIYDDEINKVYEILLSNGYKHKIKVSSNEEITSINVYEKEVLKMLWCPNYQRSYHDSFELLEFDKDLVNINIDKKYIYNKSDLFSYELKYLTYIWFENDNSLNIDEDKYNLKIDFVFDGDSLEISNENILDNIIIYNNYLYYDGSMLDDSFNVLYSYDGIYYSVYNKAFIKDNLDVIYLKMRNDDNTKESMSILLNLKE